MALREYLYIDKTRVDSYVEQLGAPVAYDKVPVVKVGLSISGPKVEASQERPGRERSAHEKVMMLVNYLEKEKLLFHGRASDAQSFSQCRPGAFRIETGEFVRAVIPSGQRSTTPAIGLWISVDDEQLIPNRLLLLEGHRKDEGVDLLMLSPLSALLELSHLVRETGQPYDEAEVVGPIPGLRRLSPLLDGKALAGEFAKNPVGFLSRLGASIGVSRRVESLYRIRRTLNDRFSDGRKGFVTIGYPIFINADG